jgi:hypothetical protein
MVPPARRNDPERKKIREDAMRQQVENRREAERRAKAAEDKAAEGGE